MATRSRSVKASSFYSVSLLLICSYPFVKIAPDILYLFLKVRHLKNDILLALILEFFVNVTLSGTTRYILPLNSFLLSSCECFRVLSTVGILIYSSGSLGNQIFYLALDFVYLIRISPLQLSLVVYPFFNKIK